jgi:hypothetical protein
MENAPAVDAVQCFIRLLNISWKTACPQGPDSVPVAMREEENPARDSAASLPEGPSITVSSTAEEYRYIVQERCPCGGEFVSGLQATGSSGGSRFDVINAVCVECGSVRQFKFSLGTGARRPPMHTRVVTAP